MRFAPTVVPPQATIDGDIDTPGDVTVQGRVEGTIQSGGTVTVIADATCVASVVARGATIHGELIGNVVCTDVIRVGPGARVVGDLRAPEVEIDGDATVDGRVDLLAPEPRTAPLRRLPLTARGNAPTRPVEPPESPEVGEPPPDFDQVKTHDAGDVEATRERGLDTNVPTAELRAPRRTVPRAPRPRGRVRVAQKSKP